ncbi:ferric-dicitrate binding protein FerR (iron transport regulator) [Filimonas zeae]|uniref:FecR family protein n=1 Tax=Filimonas zeae TaxID=1737353 RepID=A0A917IQA6_9BACT|nr:FecR domain-containing protein [Filimonas zeae]MDR6337595.1 ferric-dicitrate binding protein FerR (iron transport regulator) [Filimonas zeae]GGH59373.1 hypothetical protein GCM10011379_06070 [Filimonas zeae]
MDEKLFQELLEKQARGACTPSEEAVLLQWYEAFEVTDQKPVADEAEYSYVEQLMLTNIQQHITSRSAAGASEISLAAWWRSGWARAACFVLLLAGGILWWSLAEFRKPATIAWTTITTQQGERHRVLLPDSSVVYLDGGSVLQFPVAFTGAERRVKLVAGEVFLDIHPNTKHPFIVYTANLHVKVLGTSFMVRNRLRDTTITVAVKTGRVALQASGDTSLVLAAMGKAVYDKHRQSMQQMRCDSRAISGWVNNELFFEDDTLEAIAEVLANSYGMKYIITDEALKHKRFKAGFVHRTPDDMLRVLSKMGDFHYSIKDSVIRIYP